MVMANRNGGGGSAGWWDGLPPRVRARFAAGPPAAEPPTDDHRPLAARSPAPAPDRPPPPAPWLGDLTRLTLVLLAVALANLAVLLLALSYMAGHPFPPPGR